MKSSYELAMARLEKTAPTHSLTEEQKKKLAEIDSEYAARIAERKIFLEDEMGKAAGDASLVEDLRKQLSSEIATLEEKRELKKEKARKEEAH